MSLEHVIAAYGRAWNEPDAGIRQELMDAAWSEDGELVEPRGRFEGRHVIAERIAGFRLTERAVSATKDQATATRDQVELSRRALEASIQPMFVDVATGTEMVALSASGGHAVTFADETVQMLSREGALVRFEADVLQWFGLPRSLPSR